MASAQPQPATATRTTDVQGILPPAAPPHWGLVYSFPDAMPVPGRHE